jgi:hypothetical protein
MRTPQGAAGKSSREHASLRGAATMLAHAQVAALGLWTALLAWSLPARAELAWEVIENTCPGPLPPGQMDCTYTQRAKVPGGWLVRSTRLTREMTTHPVVPGYPGGPSGNYQAVGGAGTGVGLTFLPDPNHSWVP